MNGLMHRCQLMVKLTLLVVEEAAMKEYPIPCGGDACKVVAGVAVNLSM